MSLSSEVKEDLAESLYSEYVLSRPSITHILYPSWKDASLSTREVWLDAAIKKISGTKNEADEINAPFIPTRIKRK